MPAVLRVEQYDDELPAWELLGQRRHPSALHDPPDLHERLVLDLAVLERHLLTQRNAIQQLLDPTDIATRLLESVRDRAVDGAMLDHDAAAPFDEHRPEQPPERERQIRVTRS